ncbi:MAG: hypothetical protein K6B46_04095 [Opitutales bacterium]|nr:hypothetical protein [Opitutales bacterium]
MKIRTTLSTLTLIALGGLGAFAEPYSDASAIGFPKKTDILVHFDNDSYKTSELVKHINAVSDKLPQQTKNENGIDAILKEQNEKITSITCGFKLDDPEEKNVDGVGYIRGNGLDLKAIIQSSKSQFNKDISVQESKLCDKNCYLIAVKDSEVIAYLVQLDKKTIVCIVGNGSKKAEKSFKRLLKNREKGIGPKLAVKVKENPMLVVYANGANLPDNNGLEQGLVTVSESNSLLKVKADVMLKTAEEAQKNAQEALKDLQRASMMLSFLGTQDNPSNFEKQLLSMGAKTAAGAVVKNTDNRISLTATCDVKEINTCIDAAIEEKIWEKYQTKSIPKDEDVFNNFDGIEEIDECVEE